jgi:hypothetical protein
MAVASHAGICWKALPCSCQKSAPSLPIIDICAIILHISCPFSISSTCLGSPFPPLPSHTWVQHMYTAVAVPNCCTVQPLLDVLLFTRSLSRVMGYRGQFALYAYYVGVAWLLRALAPPLAAMTAQESALVGSFRHVTLNMLLLYTLNMLLLYTHPLFAACQCDASVAVAVAVAVVAEAAAALCCIHSLPLQDVGTHPPPSFHLSLSCGVCCWCYTLMTPLPRMQHCCIAANQQGCTPALGITC